MVAMTSTSSLRLRRPSSRMIAGVAAGIAAEIAANPDTVPLSVLQKAADWMPPSPTGIHVMGDDTRAAGWRHGRFPGLRDRVNEFHPVFDRMMVMARNHEKSVSPERQAVLRSPTNAKNLWQAAIYRWPHWFDVEADLAQIYRDGDGRLANDPAYNGQAYDADHAPDELFHQVLDVRLVDWISLLETLRVTWPAMFDAVWHRDAVAVDRMARQNRRLPDMPFLRVRKNSAERLRAVIAIFWEAERLLELMQAISGPRRVTMTKLLSALSSTSMLGSAVVADDLTARYIGSMWRHRGTLAQLFDGGLAMDHDPRHPHRSFGPGGDADINDEVEGCVTDAGNDLAGFNARSAPPFALDSRLRDVQSEEPVTFFAGRDVRELAIRFFLEVREWLGPSKGRKAFPGPPLFEMETDSAIGRLAVLTIARICPDTARSVIREVVDATTAVRSKPGFRARSPEIPAMPDQPIALTHIVASPRAWHAAFGEKIPSTSVAAQSRWLGGDVFAGMVDKARRNADKIITTDLAMLGHSISFLPKAWFHPYRETAMLHVAWNNVGRDHEIAFPGCFDRSIPADELTFCLQVAGRLQVAATDMLRDPHLRKPDYVRSPNRGRARNWSEMPPPTPPTASERLLLAQLPLAGTGGPVNRKSSRR